MEVDSSNGDITAGHAKMTRENISIQARALLNCTALAVIDLVTGDPGIDFFPNATQEVEISSELVHKSKLSKALLSEQSGKKIIKGAENVFN